MSDPIRSTASESIASSAAQSLFDGAMTQFGGHVMMGNRHVIEQARQQLHDRLDALLDAKSTHLQAVMRAMR